MNMKITFGQHLQQKQTQSLAPRMIQSMEILQMPLVELQERIEQELSENPMLELSRSCTPPFDRQGPEDQRGGT